MPWAPAALGAAPDGRLPGPDTGTKTGWVENEATPEEGAICLLAIVPVSFKAVVSAKSSNAPDGTLGVSLATSICAPVRAVPVLLLTTKISRSKCVEYR